MDREAWRAVIHGVAKSQTQLSDGTEWLISTETQGPGGLGPTGTIQKGHLSSRALWRAGLYGSPVSPSAHSCVLGY